MHTLLTRFISKILARHSYSPRLAAAGTPHAFTTHRPLANLFVILTSLRRVAAHLRHIILDAKGHTSSIGVWLRRQHHPLVVFLAEPAGLEQRDGGAAVLAAHR